MVANSELARKELKDIIYDYGLVVKDLARSAGIHPQSLYRFLYGAQELGLDKWLQILEQLPPEARERYLAVMFQLPRLENLSIEGKKRLFMQLAAEFAGNSKSVSKVLL